MRLAICLTRDVCVGTLLAALLAPMARAGQVDLVILAGQSNLAGRAVATVAVPGQAAVDEQIRFYYEVTNTAGGFFDSSGQTFGPLQPWRLNASTDNFGPEISLGRGLAEVAQGDVALIKYAVGGSDIARWQPGAVDYQQLVASVADGVDELTTAGMHVNLLGLVWLQGESDTINSSRAAAYAANLRGFIWSFRSDMNAAYPTLGFNALATVLVEPANWKNGANPGAAAASDIAVVNQALIDFAATDPHAAYLSTSDFTTFGDGVIHFGAVDQLTLGSRIASELMKFAVPEPPSLIVATVFGACFGAVLFCSKHRRR